VTLDIYTSAAASCADVDVLVLEVLDELVEVLSDVAACAVDTISNNKIKLKIVIFLRIIPPFFMYV